MSDTDMSATEAALEYALSLIESHATHLRSTSRQLLKAGKRDAADSERVLWSLLLSQSEQVTRATGIVWALLTPSMTAFEPSSPETEVAEITLRILNQVVRKAR